MALFSFVLSEKNLVIAGLLLGQVTYGSYSVFLGSLLAAGIRPIFVVVAGSITTSFLLAPFAVAFERRKWPEELRLIVIVQILLVGFGGVTVYQSLLLFGLEKTTPAISSAMTNLSPGLVFVISSCLRLEKFNIKCRYTQVKVLGTSMCVIGVLMVSLLRTTSQTSPTSSSYENPNLDWIVGCIALFVGVLAISCNQVLQAVIMKEFPAPISLCAVTLLIGAILTAIIQIIVKGKFDVGSSSVSIPVLIVYCLIIGVVTGGCASIQVWSIKKQGPVLVSIFSPISTIASAILSTLILGKVISLGSFAGIVIMFLGLYLVLWAKSKESSSIDSSIDIEETLLK